MPVHKGCTEAERAEISRFCACLANPTILHILEELAKQGLSHKEHFLHVEGISSFTVNINLRYLRKFDFVEGSLSPDSPYTVNYKKLESTKKLLDKFYLALLSYKPAVKKRSRKASGK
jgi:hypothetical protein